jgi:hypothetical protein
MRQMFFNCVRADAGPFNIPMAQMATTAASQNDL